VGISFVRPPRCSRKRTVFCSMSAEGETNDVDMGDASAAAVDEVRRDRCAKRRIRAMVSAHGTRSVRAHCSVGGKAPCIEYKRRSVFLDSCAYLSLMLTHIVLFHMFQSLCLGRNVLRHRLFWPLFLDHRHQDGPKDGTAL
jgi:hypothetical protein